ncbi:hypothetical protein MVEN_00663100 [Mycena venus]|uniref:Apple domain-containing protein n=1 Tax=Mycena venus TaxID=2733690 RepID=A0A8H6YQ46_9AGAR|nr:hypothetical protein MVEN_00663100 [Mycena venus]
MLMHLKPIALLACSALAAAAAVNIRSLKPEIGNVFAVYPGWSLVDAVENVSFNLSELACQQACSADTSCLAYVYYPYSSPGDAAPYCILKSSINVADFTIQSGVVTSVGLIGGCGTFSPVGPTLCQSVTVVSA